MRFLQIALCVSTLLLCACSSTGSAPSPGVQDIQPGERSVITPPQRAQEAPANIGERSL